MAPVEPDVPAVVGAKALRGARRHVADRVRAAVVDRLHRRRVDRVVVPGHPRVDVEVDVEDVGAHAPPPAVGLAADLDVDPAGRGEVAVGALELVLPAGIGRRVARAPVVAGRPPPIRRHTASSSRERPEDRRRVAETTSIEKRYASTNQTM